MPVLRYEPPREIEMCVYIPERDRRREVAWSSLLYYSFLDELYAPKPASGWFANEENEITEDMVDENNTDVYDDYYDGLTEDAMTWRERVEAEM